MLALNKYTNVEYFSLRTQDIAGVSYDKGDKITNPQDLRNLEILVRTRRVVPVSEDRNLQPKMFYREIRDADYVERKFGFLPAIGTGVSDDFDPAQHTVAEVVDFATDYPQELTRIIADETAGKNRTTLLSQLDALKSTVTTLTPDTGDAAGGDAVVVDGTQLGRVTSVTFGGVAGTAFSVVDEQTINVTTPANSAGAVDVVFIGADGGDVTVTDGFTYA